MTENALIIDSRGDVRILPQSELWAIPGEWEPDEIGLSLPPSAVIVGSTDEIREFLGKMLGALTEHEEKPKPLVMESRLGSIYTGPLENAYEYVRDNFYIHETWAPGPAVWRVELCDMPAPHLHPGTGLCPHTSDYGADVDYELAWRYCLGAEFGTNDPADYDDDALRAVLKIKEES